MLAIESWDCSNAELWLNVNSSITINILVLRISCLGYCDCVSTSTASLAGERWGRLRQPRLGGFLAPNCSVAFGNCHHAGGEFSLAGGRGGGCQLTTSLFQVLNKF